MEEPKRKQIRVPAQQSKLVALYRDKSKEVIDSVIARRFPQTAGEADMAQAAKKYRQALYSFHNCVTRKYRENVENVKLANDSELYFRPRVVRETPEKTQLQEKNQALMGELGKLLQLHGEQIQRVQSDVQQTAALLIKRRFEQEQKKGSDSHRIQLPDGTQNTSKTIAFKDMCVFSEMRAEEHLREADKACLDIETSQKRYQSLDTEVLSLNQKIKDLEIMAMKGLL